MLRQQDMDELMKQRQRAEEDARKKGHRFRKWNMDGEGVHQSRCANPGCKGEVVVKVVGDFRTPRVDGHVFSKTCPIKE